MKQVCVFGNGQLGCMLCQVGELLGIVVWLVGLEVDLEVVLFQQSVIMVEIECWLEIVFICELVCYLVFVNCDVFLIIVDCLM